MPCGAWQHSCGCWESPDKRPKFAISLWTTLTPLALCRVQFQLWEMCTDNFELPVTQNPPAGGVQCQRCGRWLYYLWLTKTRVISRRSFKRSTKETSKNLTNLCGCLGHMAFQVSWGFFSGSCFYFVLKTKISWVLWEIWAKLPLSA